MQNAKNEILSLYETVFGKFIFFQRFIKILLSLQEEVSSLRNQLEQERAERQTDVRDLTQAIEISATTRDLRPRTTTAADVMDRYYKSINSVNEDNTTPTN